MNNEFHKDVIITSKGQLTLPITVRRALKLGIKRKVRVAVNREGTVTIKPLPDVMSFFGKLKSGLPYDPAEKAKDWDAMAKPSSSKK